MTINLSDNNPRVSYSVGQGVTQTSFAVPFEFFSNGDLNVYVDSVLKTITTHYTVSGGDGSTGTVTISVTGATGGSTVIITRDIDLERTTDFPSSGPFNIASLNTELDRFVAMSADSKDQQDRSVRLEDSDSNISMVLPNAASRADKILAFDSTGAISMGTSGVLDLALDTVTVANLNSSADLNIKPTGGQVNILSTGGNNRFQFNNDVTPTFEIIPDSGGQATFELTTPLGADQTYTFPNATGTVALQSYVTSNSINNLSEDSTPELGGNLDVLTRSIVSSSNRDIVLAPDGTGNVKINDEKLEFTGATTDNAHQTTIVVTDPTADRTITIPDSSGTIMFSSGGAITGDTTFSDGIKAIFGAGSDLQIYHDSSSGNSFITEGGAGSLKILGTNILVKTADDSETYIDCNANGSVDLYYDNTKTFETVSGGAKTTGTHNITGDLTVGASSSEALFVDVSSEFVGINTITPRSNLHIHEPDSTHTNQIQFTNDTTGQANNDVGFKIGIGGLENAFLHNVSNTDMTLSTNDTTWVTLDVSESKTDFTYFIEAPYFQAVSDINLKENINKLDSALDKLETINGYIYNFKDNPSVPKAGLIAQEVEKILPEAVGTNEKGIKSIDYNGTIALLVEAIKEQQKQINYLKEELKS